MSKDKYSEDHFIEVAGSAGNSTLYVSNNINVLHEVSSRSLETTLITTNDLIVEDDASFGTDTDSGKFTVSNSDIDLSGCEFVGSIDFDSNLKSFDFMSRGFTSTESIDIKMVGSTGTYLALFSEGDAHIFAESSMKISAGMESGTLNLVSQATRDWTISDTTEYADDGMGDKDLFLQAGENVVIHSEDNIVLKSKGTSTSSHDIRIVNSAGGTSIPYGASLGGGYYGAISPIPTEYKYSKYRDWTNDTDATGSSKVRNDHANKYKTWPSYSGRYPDGWVTPKLEVGYTCWSGFAKARDSGGLWTDKWSDTKSWMIGIPLPTLWDDDVIIMGINYTVKRLKNVYNKSDNRNLTGLDYDGSTGTLEFIGGFMLPDYRYVNSFGDSVEAGGIPDESGRLSHGMGAYISREDRPSGSHSRGNHLIIRMAAGGGDHEFNRDYGIDPEGGGTTTLTIPILDDDGSDSGATHSMGNVMGVQVKVLIFYTRKDL